VPGAPQDTAGILCHAPNSGATMSVDRGRKKFNIPPSQEAVHRPHIRPLKPKPSGDYWDLQLGKKFVPEPIIVTKPPAEKVHNLEAERRSGYDVSEQTFPWKSKAMVSWPGKADNARNWVSSERVLETECGAKIRVPTMRQRRNDVPMSNPGDKNYCHVDYSDGFFRQEGIVVGSTVGRVRVRKEIVPGARDTKQATEPKLSYEQKKQLASHRDEVRGVGELSVPKGGEDTDDEGDVQNAGATESGEEGG